MTEKPMILGALNFGPPQYVPISPTYPPTQPFPPGIAPLTLPDPHTAALLAIAAALRDGLRDVAAAIRGHGRGMGEGER